MKTPQKTIRLSDAELAVCGDDLEQIGNAIIYQGYKKMKELYLDYAYLMAQKNGEGWNSIKNGLAHYEFEELINRRGV
jgi:hypothetical protein